MFTGELGLELPEDLHTTKLDGSQRAVHTAAAIHAPLEDNVNPCSR
jgi:hypothetical protein